MRPVPPAAVLLALFAAGGCQPKPAGRPPGPNPPADPGASDDLLAAGGPAGGAVADRNADHGYAVEWPEKPFMRGDTPMPDGRTLHTAQSAPGGIAAPVHYLILVFTPPVPKGMPPPADADAVAADAQSMVAAKEVGRRAVAIGRQRRPGVELRTAEPDGGGASPYKRTVFALYAGRSYRVEAYSADPRRLELPEADRFFASFELLD